MNAKHDTLAPEKTLHDKAGFWAGLLLIVTGAFNMKQTQHTPKRYSGSWGWKTPAWSGARVLMSAWIRRAAGQSQRA